MLRLHVAVTIRQVSIDGPARARVAQRACVVDERLGPFVRAAMQLQNEALHVA